MILTYNYLHLDTLSRFKFQNNVNSESITNLQEVLIGFGRVEDHELQNLIDAVVQNIKHHIYEADSSQNEFGSNLDSDKKLKYRSSKLTSCRFENSKAMSHTDHQSQTCGSI